MSSKFFRHLTKNSKEVTETRAKVIVRQAKTAQEKLLNNLKTDKENLELKLEELNDVFPNSTMTLKVAEGFNAERWVEDIQNTKIALLNNQVELKAAEETFNEWFVEDSGENSGE